MVSKQNLCLFSITYAHILRAYICCTCVKKKVDIFIYRERPYIYIFTHIIIHTQQKKITYIYAHYFMTPPFCFAYSLSACVSVYMQFFFSSIFLHLISICLSNRAAEFRSIRSIAN